MRKSKTLFLKLPKVSLLYGIFFSVLTKLPPSSYTRSKTRDKTSQKLCEREESSWSLGERKQKDRSGT
jgi:hypothetical protein